MSSYPTTRHGKIHVRYETSPVRGDTLCGRMASDGASVSLRTADAGNCQRCKAQLAVLRSAKRLASHQQ